MSISINGTTISEVNLNSSELTKINLNGTTVYEAIPPIYNTVKNSTSDITEAQWLEFLNAGCVAMARSKGETSVFIGKNVKLSNSVVSNYTSWKIADFNHDGSGNTVDLIQNNTIYSIKFNITISQNYYYSSSVRSWLIDSYLPGFSTNVQNKLKIMGVYTGGGNTSDKIKLLSCDEVGLTSAHTDYDKSDREGSRYPIFNAGGTGEYETDSSRVRTGTSSNWWLRSRRTNSSTYIWYVRGTGYLTMSGHSNTNGVVPAIRFE